MDQCHICLNSKGQMVSQQKFMAKCCKKRCNKKYCILCVREKFDENFKSQNYRSDTWICYACQDLCTCLFCKGIGSTKKMSKRKSVASNINYKDETDSVSVVKEKQKEKKQVRQTKQKRQAKSQKEVKDYFSQNQINKEKPFMKRIMNRKNMVYKQIISKNLEKMPEPQINPSIKIKDLIQNTLQKYQNEDDMDIQIID